MSIRVIAKGLILLVVPYTLTFMNQGIEYSFTKDLLSDSVIGMILYAVFGYALSTLERQIANHVEP